MKNFTKAMQKIIDTVTEEEARERLERRTKREETPTVLVRMQAKKSQHLLPDHIWEKYERGHIDDRERDRVREAMAKLEGKGSGMDRVREGRYDDGQQLVNGLENAQPAETVASLRELGFVIVQMTASERRKESGQTLYIMTLMMQEGGEDYPFEDEEKMAIDSALAQVYRHTHVWKNEDNRTVTCVNPIRDGSVTEPEGSATFTSYDEVMATGQMK